MDDLREAVQEDGSLQLIGSGYISWNVGDEEIVLDGRYTLEQLEFIVAHMKRPTKRAPDAPQAQSGSDKN